MKEHNNRFQLTISKEVDRNREIAIYNYAIIAPNIESARCIFMKVVLKNMPHIHVRPLRFNLKPIFKKKQ